MYKQLYMFIFIRALTFVLSIYLAEHQIFALNGICLFRIFADFKTLFADFQTHFTCALQKPVFHFLKIT